MNSVEFLRQTIQQHNMSSKVKNFESPHHDNNVALKSISKELLLIGGEGSGKTLLSRRIHECNMNFVNITPENTVPTTGSDLVDLHVNGECLSLREVGSAMSSSWNKYIFTSQYILFVVDISDPGGYPSAMIHLTELLNSLKEAERQEKGGKQVDSPIVLLIFNKTDLADSTTHSLAMNVFRLGDTISHYQSPRRKIQTFSGNCMNLQLAKMLLKWISNNERVNVDI